MTIFCILNFLVLTLLAAPLWAAPSNPVKLSLVPNNPFLFGKGTHQALVAVVQYSDGTEQEVTAQARFSSDRETVASVDSKGTVTAEGNGVAGIRATYGRLQAHTNALVQRADGPLPPSFAGDVVPVLTRIGCNGGNCHGSLNGQNGFKLSLFGYEPAADYEMIVHKHEGRRLNLADPEKSLLLQKPTFQVTHSGGQVLNKDSTDYGRLFNWIRSGAKLVPEQERQMVSLQIVPPATVLHGRNAKRQLLVTARYSDGTEGDVTRLVKFQSNDDSTVQVDPEGVVTALQGGETAVVVRGPGVAAAARIGVVIEKHPLPDMPVSNFIDRHVFTKLKSLQTPPSELVDDATFIRRASLDIIGLIPTSDEVRRFLTDKNPNRRSRLVDDLLQRPEYADFWAVYWGDRLQNSIQLLYDKGPQNFSRWLFQAFRRNMSYDRFVRKLLTATGDMYGFTQPTSFYPFIKKPADMAAVTSQLFLGVRIECARCHNHPFEKWTRDDFRGMAAFFSQYRHKASGPRHNQYILYLDFKAQFEDPDTNQTYWPKPLNGSAIIPEEWTDRRELLADWMTSRNNPFFARTIVNRMWSCFMGRGLVEPVDDFRLTNPPSNEPLLNALAQDFVEHGYDLHQLIRRITSSRAYQLSSVPNEWNREDKMAFSRHYPRHLTGEQALDSISLATGIPEKFSSLYPGTRAAQLTHPEVESYFLDVFDRSPRKEVCERKFNLTLNQVIHRISGETIHEKIADKEGILSRMLVDKRPSRDIVEELYLRSVARMPNPQEQARAETAIARAGDLRRGLQDLFWALLNSKEFLSNH